MSINPVTGEVTILGQLSDEKRKASFVEWEEKRNRRMSVSKEGKRTSVLLPTLQPDHTGLQSITESDFEEREHSGDQNQNELGKSDLKEVKFKRQKQTLKAGVRMKRYI